MRVRILFITILFVFFLISTTGQNCNDAIHNGEGTYYEGVDGSSGGNCSLPVIQNDFMHCALNTIDYDNSNACGAFIEVTGPKGKVVLKVVDRCPECNEGDVDMTEQAFSQIADVIDGRVPVSWRFIPADTEQSIKINFKFGSSEFWTAIQFRDIEHAIAKMEYQKEDGSWQTVDRVLYNFFVESSGIKSPMNIRITSVLGEEIVFENIELNLDDDYDTGLQFTTPQECVGNLAITEFEKKSFVLYPNPTLGTINLKGAVGKWILWDHSGKKLYKGNTLQIDLSNLSEGLYFLELNNQVKKIIKQ